MKITEQEYTTLLLEEQFVGRIKNTLQAQEAFFKGVMKKDPHNLDARMKLPKVQRDLKQITAVSAAQAKMLVESLEVKYEFKFESIRYKETENSEPVSELIVSKEAEN